MQDTEQTLQPLVSVILCNYNYGKYIGQAIESVLGQTYQNFELIVIDDASTDNSAEVITSYRDKLQFIGLERNSGQGAVFNIGLRQSKGEIICFLDSDDYFHIQKLQKTVHAFRVHPEWVQVSHAWTSVDSENRITGSGTKSFVQGDVRRMLLKWGRYPCAITSGLSYRRFALEKISPIPDRSVIVAGQPYNNGADCYMVATVPFYGQVGYINEALMFYRVHGKNRRAYTDDYSYPVQGCRAIGEIINAEAEKHGFGERFDLENDGDYLSLQALQLNQPYPLWKMIVLTLQEAIDCNVQPRDALERLLRRGICAASPRNGKDVIRLGLRRYLRSRLAARQYDAIDGTPSSHS
ncbi:glycosyltransferase family 2 protein [Gloeobacter kilaueensis]|uniref:Glycosyl transferase family 2 n=1 Tax=Gloeobacter kilaueensis (strain ATCC BAA-2537 / CCAP 1431/1 / ULC 316 / JS1) TaxID=1183438 RepID=U5QCF8_GLOK1|nr:glycosyltransferase family 2 protein [Gloeobacter kilaueensis]AGY56518.1 glycosyl transferase family 2 [Gloeobacter kilaueensis JS1]